MKLAFGWVKPGFWKNNVDPSLNPQQVLDLGIGLGVGAASVYDGSEVEVRSEGASLGAHQGRGGEHG